MINRRIFGQPHGPRGLELPHPAPRRRRPHLRLAHGLPVHHRAGAAVLEQPFERHGPARAARGRQEQLHADPDRSSWCCTILFSYSSFPLRLAALVGFLVAAVSFLLGAVYLVRGLFGGTHVEGWTTLVVLLAVFNGFTIALLSMLGEYVVRTLNAVSAQETYHVVERVSWVTAALPVIGASAAAPPTCRAARRASRDRDGPAGPARAEGLPVRRSSPSAVWTGTERRYFAHATTRRCWREEHQLHRGRRGGRACAARAGRRRSPRAAARPGRARGLELAVQHRTRAEDRPLEQALRGEPRRPARLGPGSDLGVAVRLPRARTVLDYLKPWFDRLPETRARDVPRGPLADGVDRDLYAALGVDSGVPPAGAARQGQRRARNAAGAWSGLVAGCAPTSPTSDEALGGARSARRCRGRARRRPTRCRDE